MIRRLLALILFAALATGQAEAGLLSLNFHGVTDEFSSLDGSPIDLGTPFVVHAIFDSTPLESETGAGLYLPTSITAVVAGTPYSAIFDSGDYSIELYDPTANFIAPYYFVILTNLDFSGIFAPYYSTATPVLDGSAATQTAFSDYEGTLTLQMKLPTASGDLILTYDAEAGVVTTITAVPEPASVGLVMLGCVGGIALIRRRVSAFS